MGVESGGSVSIEQRVAAPPEKVSAYVSDFRNAVEWMVGVEEVERLGEETYRLAIDSPIGKIKPEVRLVEKTPESISWVYTSTIEGGGRVDVSGPHCLLSAPARPNGLDPARRYSRGLSSRAWNARAPGRPRSSFPWTLGPTIAHGPLANRRANRPPASATPRGLSP